MQSLHLYFLAIFCLVFSNVTIGQTTTNIYSQENVESTIRELDRKFWIAYNNCDAEGMETFLTEDLEFYHDKGGLTETRSKLTAVVKEGLCGNENFRTRREAIENTVKIFPLNNYGAIISGDHYFYMTEKGKAEYLTGIAKFTHVWRYANEEWKMSRVLSYDHQPASANDTKKAIEISANNLAAFVGTYQAPQTGKVIISIKESQLHMAAVGLRSIIYAEQENLFFHKEAPLTFEFVKNADGKATKFIVRENGAVVEEALRTK